MATYFHIQVCLCFPSITTATSHRTCTVVQTLKVYAQVWSRCCGLPSGATAPFGARFQCCCCCPCSSGHRRRRRGSAPRARAASTTLPNIDHSHLGAHLSTEGAVPRRTEQESDQSKKDDRAGMVGRQQRRRLACSGTGDGLMHNGSNKCRKGRLRSGAHGHATSWCGRAPLSHLVQVVKALLVERVVERNRRELLIEATQGAEHSAHGGHSEGVAGVRSAVTVVDDPLQRAAHALPQACTNTHTHTHTHTHTCRWQALA